MNDIKSITITIVVTSIVVGICELLLPKNEYKNQMRLITGTVLLLSIISPFSYEFEKIDFDFNNQVYDYNITHKTEKSVALSLNYEIKKILNENDVFDGRIIIQTENENDIINIKDVHILFHEDDMVKTDAILNKINDNLNIKVKAGVYNEWVKI